MAFVAYDRVKPTYINFVVNISVVTSKFHPVEIFCDC
jgi:hypothetical protein